MSEQDFHNSEDRAAAEDGRDEQVTGASGGPVDEGDMAAADGLAATPEQAAHYEEMTRKGAAQRGEGAV